MHITKENPSILKNPNGSLEEIFYFLLSLKLHANRKTEITESRYVFFLKSKYWINQEPHRQDNVLNVEGWSNCACYTHNLEERTNIKLLNSGDKILKK